jgi:hypothetical protein
MKALLFSKDNIDLLSSTASKLLKLKNIVFSDSDIFFSIENHLKQYFEASEIPKSSSEFLEINSKILTNVMKELEQVYVLKQQDIEMEETNEVYRSTARAEVNIIDRSLDTRTNILEQNDS